ncbi:MAG: aminopeptidase P family protein, partial [Acidobacteriota bacterium]|nr:aminopeptidase P family protein [Acidobacteriota bacterium]
MKLLEIQDQLRRQQIDGWLFFDHHQRDPLAYRVLGFSPPRQVTRRWYYWIPANGDPRGLVHRIEAGMLDALPGDRILYSSWQEQVNGLAQLLAGSRRIAMQYSPDCKIPYVSMVDGGTIDLVRQTGAEVVSSAELIQYFEARLDADGLASHLEAGRRVDLIRAEAFRFIG